MAQLEELTPGARVAGLIPGRHVEVVQVDWHGTNAITLTYRDESGRVDHQLVYRDAEASLQIESQGPVFSFDGDAKLFRLASEALRIRLAYLFDPLLAVHISKIEPLPHQIAAVYQEMLPRQPLRYLLADDPGAGKTIMTGLFLRELIIRGDVSRCLIVAPGSLVEQWQDELGDKFNLDFDIITRETIENSRSGNPYAERDLVISRLDHLARNDELLAKLEQTDWDLVVVDEAHKMSAHYFGNELKETKRYKLGKLLGGVSRHFLLLTATPHAGKEADFQLFMALLDADRFEGRYRDGVHSADASDLMRRLVKEKLLKFDGRPLFPERRAYTVEYPLSDLEAHLYNEVTNYVRDEMNRAERLKAAGEGRRGAIVGFALTTLQRRLASSPEAIYQSVVRRRKRLENRLREEELRKRGAEAEIDTLIGIEDLDEDDIDNIDERPDSEVEEIEEEVVDQASAAHTISELKAEIATLERLEELAAKVRSAHTDKKWEELRELLLNNQEMFDRGGARRKLIIFSEHRDTLTYVAEQIRLLLGQPEAVVTIHGGMGREDRRKAQEAFTQDKDVLVLVATDAAGEGINLQRAHLLVNYDLPWNPNRIEQRFGRIHRIGQFEVCHMWNLVAVETREGEVFKRLLEKLEKQRDALGGQVFDVLGQVFSERSLRDLLIDAVRYGERPDVQMRLEQVVDQVMEDELRRAVEERALASDVMTGSDVERIREDMERAEARKLQPHFIRSFFIEAFARLGGAMTKREEGRYEVTHVPAAIRNRDRVIGHGPPVQKKYERVTFEKSLISIHGKPPATFVCPGHPLLDAVIDVVLERHRTELKRGAVLVDPVDEGEDARVLLYLEEAIQDGRTNRDGGRRVVSRRLHFVEVDEEGNTKTGGYAPYLDYRPLEGDEPELVQDVIRADWLRGELERMGVEFAIGQTVPEHLEEVQRQTTTRVQKTIAAVRERLTKEINHWDQRALDLERQEEAGKQPRLNSAKARQRAEELAARLHRRTEELKLELQLAPQPPLVVGGAIVLPIGLFERLRGHRSAAKEIEHRFIKRIERLAVDAVLRMEKSLGREPEEQRVNNPGFDVLSKDPRSGDLLFIEVKGRFADAATVSVTRNEILTARNREGSFILALAKVSDDDAVELRYLRDPFAMDEDTLFDVTSVNFDLRKLFGRAETPA